MIARALLVLTLLASHRPHHGRHEAAPVPVAPWGDELPVVARSLDELMPPRATRAKLEWPAAPLKTVKVASATRAPIVPWGDELAMIERLVTAPITATSAKTLEWPAAPLKLAKVALVTPAPIVPWGDELATVERTAPASIAAPLASTLVWPASPLKAVAAAPVVVAAAPTSPWGDELTVAAGRMEPQDQHFGIEPSTLDWPAPPLLAPPKTVRAIYVNAWAFGSSRFYDLVQMVSGTEINAFVIDVKDDTGYLTYESQVPTAQQIGANHALRARDTRARLRYLMARGIYPIARIVVAKDPLLAAEKPEWSVQDVRGGLWRDRLNFAWVDAFNDSVWVYASQLGAEAIRTGFAELQFDYVRFPDEPKGRLAMAKFPGRREGETTRDGVRRNLQLLRDRVKPLGVPFTIDVFGLTASAETDLGIGQVWEDLATTADVVLPMVYPSHYYHGFYDIPRPNDQPYRTIRRAMQDAVRRTTPLSPAAQIRPYLQAFTLGPPRYTPALVREQIRAAEEMGVNTWVLWNPRGVYDPAMFRREQTPAMNVSHEEPEIPRAPAIPFSE